MRILFYTMNWYPFDGSIQHIYSAVLKHLKNQGHKITILTSIPYFMNSREKKWHNYKGKFFINEKWKGIKVTRSYVLSPYFMRFLKLTIRLINCISFSLTSLLASFFTGKQDVILTVSHPPVLIGIASFIISHMKGCRYIYCLQDIYPDILVNLKILKKKSLFHNLLKQIELFIYNKAEKICVLSKEMKGNLESKNVNSYKIEVIPHFADLTKITPRPKNNSVAKKYNLDSKFIVLLPGSISYRYGIDNIYKTAKLLQENENIRVVFVDKGELRGYLKKKSKMEKIKNIVFLPFQPIEKFPELLASSDICIVSLESIFTSYSVPSKLYNILASARPVLAIANETSEVSKIIKKARCGISIPPGNASLIMREIQNLYNNREQCRIMGMNGRAFAEKNFNSYDIVRKYEEVIYNARHI